MDQQELMKAQFVHQQMQEMQTHLEMLDTEMLQLEEYSKNLNFLKTNKEKEVLASIGKGLHVKTSLVSSELFVEVGAGVVVKKTPEEAVKIIDLQLDKLKEARLHLVSKIDIYSKTLESIVDQIQKSQEASK